MYNVEAHELAAQELEELPDRLRGQMYRLIERLEALEEGEKLKMPHSRPLGGGLFELRVGGTDIARTLYCYAKRQHIYLLYAFVKKTQTTPAQAMKIARKRLEDFQ